MPSQGEEDWSPRFNVAPTQPIPFIRQHPGTRARIVTDAPGISYRVQVRADAPQSTIDDDSHHGFADGDSKYASDWLRSSIGVGMTPSADNAAIIPDHEPKQEQSLDHQRSSMSQSQAFKRRGALPGRLGAEQKVNSDLLAGAWAVEPRTTNSGSMAIADT